MLKDNENVPLPIVLTDEPDTITGPQPFTPDQMVGCTKCLRANPPTRLNCLYCGVALPSNEVTLEFQKPTLRRLEKWELGYNNILSVSPANEPAKLAEINVADVAALLKLDPADLNRIIELQTPLPLAHAASSEEAELINRRLQNLGIAATMIADRNLGVTETGPLRVRAMELGDKVCRAYSGSESLPVEIRWEDIFLVVAGRLITTRMEMKEQKAKRAEAKILESSEFFSDEVVCDFYAEGHPDAFRISANSFDFSCLGKLKKLVAGQNMTTLITILRERALQAGFDDSYISKRKALEPVWSSEQQIASGGWRRERPGKYSIGSVMEKSNERQFTRYSLLSRYLLLESRAAAK